MGCHDGLAKLYSFTTDRGKIDMFPSRTWSAAFDGCNWSVFKFQRLVDVGLKKKSLLGMLRHNEQRSLQALRGHVEHLRQHLPECLDQGYLPLLFLFTLQGVEHANPAGTWE